MLYGRHRPESDFPLEVLRNDTYDETSGLRSDHPRADRAFDVASCLEIVTHDQQRIWIRHIDPALRFAF